MSEDTQKFVVVDPIRYNDTDFTSGTTLNLTEDEAERYGDAIRLIGDEAKVEAPTGETTPEVTTGETGVGSDEATEGVVEEPTQPEGVSEVPTDGVGTVKTEAPTDE